MIHASSGGTVLSGRGSAPAALVQLPAASYREAFSRGACHKLAKCLDGRSQLFFTHGNIADLNGRVRSQGKDLRFVLTDTIGEQKRSRVERRLGAVDIQRLGSG